MGIHTPEVIEAAATAGRAETIHLLRDILKRRTGRAWSVTGGNGSAWGWITVISRPASRDERGNMTADDAATLTEVFGRPVYGSHMIPSGTVARRAALHAANGSASLVPASNDHD